MAERIVDLIFSLVGIALDQHYMDKRRKTMQEFLAKMSSPTMKIELVNPPKINMEPNTATASEEPCEICSVKHLLSSKTFLIEGRTRKGEEKQRKVLEAYRELQAAEQHLVEKHPDLAAEVRALRKEIEACAFTGEFCDEVDIAKIDLMIKKIIPHIPREHYFKPIEKVEA